jgi:PilZ domain-containing protein
MARAHVRQLPPSAEQNLSERRVFARQKTRWDAVLYVHGRFQNIIIHNISRSGMKLKNAFGLVPGDVMSVELVSHRIFDGTVVWSVAPYTGIAFTEFLEDDDPILAGVRWLS